MIDSGDVLRILGGAGHDSDTSHYELSLRSRIDEQVRSAERSHAVDILDTLDGQTLYDAEVGPAAYLAALAREIAERRQQDARGALLAWRPKHAGEEELLSRVRQVRRVFAREALRSARVNPRPLLELVAALLARPWVPEAFPADPRVMPVPVGDITSRLDLAVVPRSSVDELLAVLNGPPQEPAAVAGALDAVVSRIDAPPPPAVMRAAAAYLAFAAGQVARLNGGGREYLLRGLFVSRVRGSEGQISEYGSVHDVLVTVFPTESGRLTVETVGIEEPSVRRGLWGAFDAANDWLGQIGHRSLAPQGTGLSLVVGDYPGGVEIRRVSGESLGLMLAVGLLGHATTQPIDPLVAGTGALEEGATGSTVAPVGGVQAKAEAAAWRGMSAVVVPAGENEREAEAGIDQAAAFGVRRQPVVRRVVSLREAQRWFLGTAYSRYRERIKGSVGDAQPVW